MSVGLGEPVYLIKYCEVFSYLAGENVKRENGNCYLDFDMENGNNISGRR